MKIRQVLTGLAVAVVLPALMMAAAQASIITFSGQDDGAPVGGPFPNSTAAQANFETAASAFGTLNTINYENLATGFYSPIAAAPGVSISLNATNYGNGFSGISNITSGNLYGFNVTPGGNQWLGFPGGSATFTFATPTHSFGTWITGIQTFFTTALTLTFVDGSSETLNAPLNVNGGAQYYGFTDTAAVSSITITNNSNDAWGIDDTTYNAGAPVPEPSSLLLLGAALFGFGVLRLRKA